MEINYKTIFQYLCSEDTCQPTNDDFPTRKNIMISSDNFPDKISQYLTSSTKNKFYRYGVTRYNNKQINISFITSLLTLLDKNFITYDKKEELTEVKNFIDGIREKVIDKKFKFELKSKFENHIILDRIEDYNIEDGILIQTIIQLLDINIIIMDFNDLKINTLFKGDYLNPWKVTLLLAKKDKDWEPLFCDKKQFSYNDSFLKKILTSEEIVYYNNDYLNKSYSLMDNIKEIANIDNIEEEDEEEEESVVSDNNIEDDKNEDIEEKENTVSDDENLETFINPIEDIKNMKLTKTKLKYLKKDQIYELINRLSIDINKDINKNEMIQNLLPYI